MNAWAKRALGMGVLVFALTAAERSARAELDHFGTGNGHSGAFSANASGMVVNAYAPLAVDAAVGDGSVTIGTKIGAAAGFVPGDLVLVWRATGLDAAVAPSGSAGRVNLSSAAVGQTELARVASVNGAVITFTSPLTASFAKDMTQLVKIPEFTSVSIPSGTSVVAAPWQSVGTGFAGGIVAFLANGGVTLDGTIDASAMGFRGGAPITRPLNALLNSCPNVDGVSALGYAPKGEGFVSSEFSTTGSKGGRGNRSIAGGGGNCFENGGAGGANFGNGGAGGVTILGALLGTNVAGLGGAGADYSLLSRLSLGGGGGAGEQKDALGSGGGAGGGAVLVRARSLAGAGSIKANGETAKNAKLLGLLSDGAGGGGAGGSIVVRVVDALSCGTLEAKGGNGGNSNVIGLDVFGPGGGGGGGRVLVHSKDGGSCATNVNAGLAGYSGPLLRQGAGPTSPTDPDSIGTVEAVPTTVTHEGAPTPTGPDGYCYANYPTDGNCTADRPICDLGTGFCIACGAGECAVCASDSDCSSDQYCSSSGQCLPRPVPPPPYDGGAPDAGGPTDPGTSTDPTDPVAPGAPGATDAGTGSDLTGAPLPIPNDADTIAGGGCACRTTNGAHGSSSGPLAVVAAVLGSVFLRRRAKKAGAK